MVLEMAREANLLDITRDVFFGINAYFDSEAKRNAVGMAISHVDDSLVPRTEYFISYLSGGLDGACDVKVYEGMVRFI